MLVTAIIVKATAAMVGPFGPSCGVWREKILAEKKFWQKNWAKKIEQKKFGQFFFAKQNSGRWQLTVGRWQLAGGGWQVADGGQ